MEFQSYKEKKEKGIINLVKVGGSLALAVKRFNPETGDALPVEFQAIDEKIVNDTISMHQKIVADLEELKADIQVASSVS